MRLLKEIPLGFNSSLVAGPAGVQRASPALDSSAADRRSPGARVTLQAAVCLQRARRFTKAEAKGMLMLPYHMRRTSR